jgi:hypothetical protein
MKTEGYYYLHISPPANLKLHILFQCYRFLTFLAFSTSSLIFFQGIGLDACGYLSLNK